MDIVNILEHLSDLQWNPDHTLFDRFVSTLVLNELQDVRIVFCLVDHYLDYREFRTATQILTSTGRMEPDAENKALQEINEVLLDIARARVQLRTTINVEAALDLKRKLDAITVSDEGLIVPSGTKTGSFCEQWVKFKLHQSLLSIDLRKAGHISKTKLTDEVESWVERAIEYLGGRDDITARRMEFVILANFSPSDPNQQTLQSRWLQNLLSRCPDNSLEKVNTTRLHAISTLSTSRMEGLLVLEGCENYYRLTGNVPAQLGMELLRMILDTATRDKVSRYLELGNRCLGLRQFGVAQICIDQAELNSRDLNNRWAAFEKIDSLAENIFHLTGDIWSANEHECLRYLARSFSPPRNPADLRTTISIMEKMKNEKILTPSQDHAIWRTLGDCAKELMRFDLLDECERRLLEHEYTKLDHENKSLIINDYSMSTHTRIVAEYNQPLTEESRRDIYKKLKEEIEKLEASFDQDQQHNLPNLAKIKLERLIMYYHTIDLKHPEHRVFAKMSKRSCYSRYRQYQGFTTRDTLIEELARQDGFSTSSSIETADRNLKIVKAEISRNEMHLAEAYLLCAIARRSALNMRRQLDQHFAISQEIIFFLKRSQEATKRADPSGILLMRITTTLLGTVADLIHLDKSNETKYLRDVHDFLFEIEEAITRQRGSDSNTGLPVFMEDRRLESNYMRRDFYRQVEHFYYKMDLLGDWWAWHERARSRTLNVRLAQLSSNSSYELPKDAAGSQKMFSRLFESAVVMDSTLSLVVVDFHFSLKGELSLVTTDSQKKRFEIVATDLSRDFVESWHQRVMKDPVVSLREPGNLRDLQAFADAVEKVTTEKDLICFLPPYPLDQFPLHAAMIQEQSILERNTIIYATSLTSLLHCFESSNSAEPVQLKNSMTFRHAYDRIEEQSRISQSHRSICESFELDSPTDQIKKADFEQDLRDLAWIHFHGHVVSLANGPLEQAFRLQDGELTVGEIFNQCNFRNSAIIAIACGSGTHDNNQANEPLGLSPVLITAGATTVLSTLWRVDSSAGRIFSEKFYKAIHRQLDSAKGEHYINVAQALKDATVNLRDHRGPRSANERFNAANHWAAYIMHGSPFFKMQT